MRPYSVPRADSRKRPTAALASPTCTLDRRLLARLQTVRAVDDLQGCLSLASWNRAFSAQLDVKEIEGVRNPTHAPATTFAVDCCGLYVRVHSSLFARLARVMDSQV